MVSLRCKIMVKAALDNLGIEYGAVDLGEAEIKGITPEQHEQLEITLLKSGLELMDDKRSILIEKIKLVIIEVVHYTDELPKIKNSEYISEKLNHDYTYLANLFSETMGTTIEQFIINHKIERVKELIIYDELNLTEIAWKLHYSSVSHLSRQFKKTTGLTPSFYKSLRHIKRAMLNDV